MVKRTAKQKLYRWHISRIRKKGEFLGIVEAPDETTAIKTAIERFEMTEPWEQARLVARREA